MQITKGKKEKKIFEFETLCYRKIHKKKKYGQIVYITDEENFRRVNEKSSFLKALTVSRAKLILYVHFVTVNYSIESVIGRSKGKKNSQEMPLLQYMRV